MLSLPVLATLISAISALPIGSDSRIPSPTSSEDLFPTDIGFFGVTATNSAPFMAQTDGAAITYGVPTSSYTLAQPIETAIQAKDHREGDQNIFQLMGSHSPYYISDGWGVYDYAIPGQCSISQVHLLSRHGSRYPTGSIETAELLSKKNYSVNGELEFLKDWKYSEGVGVLTKLGNQQLFDKGVRTFFRYGQLQDWNEDAEKIVARTTSQERITSSAEYFLAGFYGLDWYDKANLEIIIESNGYNDTLAPYEHCPLTDKTEATASIPADGFLEKYTKKAVERLNKQIKGLTFNAKSIHQMQELCAYETNNNGFSHFCGLFTQQEWEDYEYYNSWTWYNSNMFGSPNGRAMGAGWVEEFKQRLTDSNDFDWNTLALQNTTLDTNPTYFPVDQKLYFDFSHDSVISNIFTALGMEQFKTNFTVDGSLRETNFQLSKVVPFASQTYFEIIECDGEVSANRTEPETSSNSTTGTPNKYVHMILNDHTIDLSKNFPEYCSPRVDGWCEFDSFVKYLDTLWEVADFEEACFSGTYNTTQIVTDGAPEK
ncbi:3-phytase A [Pichia kudriavzevii]|uniref:3-phytase A n=1 Tax=Pichia kudriavzevii TaxID=4909 RepID=A0A1V2LF03_PICKU|nr:3-phytase A [Pichia kudriavzevii]